MGACAVGVYQALLPRREDESNIILLFLADNTLNFENVYMVTATVNNKKLGNILCVPGHIWNRMIKEKNTFDYRKSVIEFFLNYSYSADWCDLAGRLHYWQETQAVKKAKRYLKSSSSKLYYILLNEKVRYCCSYYFRRKSYL